MPLKDRNEPFFRWVRCVPAGIVLFFAFCIAVVPSVYARGAVGPSQDGGEGPKDIVDPHWTPDRCNECHEGRAEKGEPLSFRYDGDFIRLCNRCHEEISAHAYIHATGMVPGEEKLERMPPDFKDALYRGDSEGRLTCIVCHNLVYQCLEEEFGRRENNPLFLRGGPFARRTDLCYRCHEPEKYARLNPHDQISDEGEILTSICSVCHRGVPDVKTADGIEDVEFKVEKDLERLCRRCHFDMPLHPGTFIAMIPAGGKRREPFTHLRVPSPAVMERIKEMTVLKDIIIPLEPGTGKIFCATCHNPHERGIQRLRRADRGADNVQRLRAGRTGEICLMCHEK